MLWLNPVNIKANQVPRAMYFTPQRTGYIGQLETRQLGTTDLNFTTMGLGTWAIGGPWDWGWSKQSDEDSIATIQHAIDLGINWLDTAPCYGLGHSEEIVGKAVKGRRDRVLIATKCGLVWDDRASGKVRGWLKSDSVRREVEASLRRLAVDVIDLYHIHFPDPDEDIEHAWNEMNKMVDEGLVRYVGVSNFNPAQVDRVRRMHPVASHQPPYSMLQRDIENELLPYCSDSGIGVIVYGPLQAGLLTGKFTRDKVSALAPDDWRNRSEHFRGKQLTRNLIVVDQLRPVAADLGLTLAQLAIAWTLRRPEVTSAIVGARTPDQIEQTVVGADAQIPDETAAEIEKILLGEPSFEE